MAAAMAAPCSAYRPTPFLGLPPRQFEPSSFRQHSLSVTFKITALFWMPKRTAEPCVLNLSLGTHTLTGSAPEGISGTERNHQKISISVVSAISEIPSQDWDACAVDAAGPEKFDPFISHAFLMSLEESRSAVKLYDFELAIIPDVVVIAIDCWRSVGLPLVVGTRLGSYGYAHRVSRHMHIPLDIPRQETGWLPQHVVAQDENKNTIGVVPLYLKSHSNGEFVFDYSWADAYYRYGQQYYPKLQSCVPFTPVTGPRILVRNIWCKDQVFDMLVLALKDLAAKLQVSSLHVTFPSETEWQKMKSGGFLQRIGMQYHWKNRNYKNFDEFLMDMKQSKRKNIRQERKKISAQNLVMKRLRGDEIKAEHWDSFYKFYRNTTDNKWGRAYLTRDFFHSLGSRMADRVLLVVAEEEDEFVAGALNLIGGDTLFGRLWGCLPRAYYPSLHFEACYYQAIEAAIELNLNKVEAGAQGEHKIQRGYLPVITYSCHYLLDDGFRKAIGEFLVHEADQVKRVIKLLHDSGPFKDGID